MLVNLEIKIEGSVVDLFLLCVTIGSEWYLWILEPQTIFREEQTNR